MTRALLVVICVVLFALAIAGLRLGWRRRAARQSGLVLPAGLPASLGAALLPALDGLYVGTTYATSWQDRVVAGGLGARAAASLQLHDRGAVIDRQGADAIFIPRHDLVGARLEPALAGKVVGAGGLLVIRWRTGSGSETVELDTGFRADDKSQYPRWVSVINELQPAGTEGAAS